MFLDHENSASLAHYNDCHKEVALVCKLFSSERIQRGYPMMMSDSNFAADSRGSSSSCTQVTSSDNFEYFFPQRLAKAYGTIET